VSAINDALCDEICRRCSFASLQSTSEDQTDFSVRQVNAIEIDRVLPNRVSEVPYVFRKRVPRSWDCDNPPVEPLAVQQQPPLGSIAVRNAAVVVPRSRILEPPAFW